MTPPVHSESQLARAGAPRRRVHVAVVSGDGASLTYKLEVLGHEVVQVRTGRQALDLPSGSIDVYLIENTLPDMSGSSLAELLRMDQSRSGAWIFGIATYARVHRAVSHDTGVFDDVIVAPVDEPALRRIIDRARSPRSAASN